jgi:hypothetical protein
MRELRRQRACSCDDAPEMKVKLESEKSTRLPNGISREEAVDETHLIDDEEAEGQTH